MLVSAVEQSTETLVLKCFCHKRGPRTPSTAQQVGAEAGAAPGSSRSALPKPCGCFYRKWHQENHLGLCTPLQHGIASVRGCGRERAEEMVVFPGTLPRWGGSRELSEPPSEEQGLSCSGQPGRVPAMNPTFGE